MTTQLAKDRIDGFHALAADNALSIDDARDEVCNLIADQSSEVSDELYDYAWESFQKFGLDQIS